MTSLKLTYHRPAGVSVDLAVTAPLGATVGSLAAALSDRDPAMRAERANGLVTLALHGDGGPRALDPRLPVAEAGLGSGVAVSLRPASVFHGDLSDVTSAGELRVVSGPDRGRSYSLHAGTNLVGRDPSCRVRLSDPLVSKLHATVHMGSSVEIKDANSTNGVEFGGGLVSRAVLRPGDHVRLGDTVIEVLATAQPTSAHIGAHRLAAQMFNRSPRLDPTYEGVEFEAPAPPKRAPKRRFPIIAMVAPVFMGLGLYLATGSRFALIFVLLGPLMAVGNWLEDRITRKRDFKTATADFRAALSALDDDLTEAAQEEHMRRNASHPPTTDLVSGAHSYGPLLWTRRPEHASFLDLRLGVGTLPSKNKVVMPARSDAPQELWTELRSTIAPFATVEAVPVVASLPECGAVGIAGPDDGARRVARSVLTQLVTLHSPAEVMLAAVMSQASMRHWEWLKWLPHTSPYPLSTHTPLRCDHLTTGGASALALVSELDDLIVRRSQEGSRATLPAVVLFVSDDTDVDRGRLVDIAERGPKCGVYVVWLSVNVVRLPAVCRTFVEVAGDGSIGDTGYVRTGELVTKVWLDRLSGDETRALALRLSPVIDAGARVSDESDLPRAASFVTLSRAPLDHDPQAVLDKWAEAHTGLRALVGALGADEPFHIDLVAHGPHALVGGTTGAGKSELLQTWLLGMASACDPRRVNFLLVDYKGGSAFGVINTLPHAVGLVTDLDPHLVRRALTSLRAELTRRERIVEAYRAKDLSDLEKKQPNAAPPRLVIVVDEFAALKKEIPEFVDGMVDIAQRGRSLGLHLILATQRPTGVISDQLRANTNLRVALRMADAGDSNDVIGTSLAATFDLDIPGRAAVRNGPGRVVVFQTAYAGGWTSPDAAGQDVMIKPMPFGTEEPWRADYTAPDQATDISRIVDTIRLANARLAIHPPRKPWLQELPTLHALADKPSYVGPGLLFGLKDLPQEQAQPPALFDPDIGGNMLIYGAGGAGKSTVLRTLAISAARGDAGPCHIYAMDFGNRGLDLLQGLPTVAPVVLGDDQERLTRLLDRLQRTVRDRQQLFTTMHAKNITEYWAKMSTSDGWRVPRILLLLDGANTFYQQFPPGVTGLYERLVSIANLGRGVGIHLVMTSDRPNSVPGSLAAAAQTRLVLRLTTDGDYNLLGIRTSDALASDSPPGRGLLDRAETQVSIAGGGDVEGERAYIADLALRLDGAPSAAPIEVMPTEVRLSELPSLTKGATIGVEYESLEAVGFEPSGFFVVTGLAGSGRTTALRSICASLQRWRPSMPLHLLARAPGDLAESVVWHSSATDADSVRKLAESLAAELGATGGQGEPRTIVIEGFPDLVDVREVGAAIEKLLRTCRDSGHFVVAEGESGRMINPGPIYQLIKSRRSGIALQQAPALQFSQIFSLEQAKMPKMSSPPPGRGLLVVQGNASIVHIAMPG